MSRHVYYSRHRSIQCRLRNCACAGSRPRGRCADRPPGAEARASPGNTAHGSTVAPAARAQPRCCAWPVARSSSRRPGVQRRRHQPAKRSISTLPGEWSRGCAGGTSCLACLMTRQCVCAQALQTEQGAAAAPTAAGARPAAAAAIASCKEGA